MNYLFEIYEKDELMIKEYPVICFEKLTDKSIISTLNNTQRSFVEDGYKLYDFIEDGILNTIEINRQVNFDWVFSIKIDGKKNIFMLEKNLESFY